MKYLIVRMPNGQTWKVDAAAVAWDFVMKTSSNTGVSESPLSQDDVLIQHLRRMTWEEIEPFAVNTTWPDDMQEQFEQAEIEVVEHTPEYDPSEALKRKLKDE